MTLYRVRSSWSGGRGGGLLSTMYFDVLPGSASDANAAVGAFWDDVKGFIANDLTVTTDAAVYLIDETNGQPTSIEAVTPIAVAGSQSAEPLPWANQVLLQWRTGLFSGGRELRGRTFIPGCTETGSTDGLPATGTLSAVNAAAATLIADANTELVIYSPTNGTAGEVIAGTCWNEFAVLRSRRQ